MEGHLGNDCACLLCGDDPGGDWYDQQVSAHVRKFGWHVTAVLGDNRAPGWAYTIGMWHTYRRPELVVCGLSMQSAHGGLHLAATGIRDGQPIADDGTVGWLPGDGAALRPVDASWAPDLLGAAISFYRAVPPTTQLVWADDAGRFPWDRGASDRCRTNQPMLWLAKDDNPPDKWTRLYDDLPAVS